MKNKPKIEKTERVAIRFSGVNEAARQLGVSPGHISYILHGKRKPGRKLAAKMAKLGITVENDE